MPPCLTLSIIRYISRIKWSNPGNGVTLSLIRWCCSYWKGSLLATLDNGHQLYLLSLYLYFFLCHPSWSNNVPFEIIKSWCLRFKRKLIFIKKTIWGILVYWWYWIGFFCLMAYQLFLGYLMLKPFSLEEQ